MIYQFKIQIKGITKPPVWRRLLVPENYTFERFHSVIQIAFGWENAHLYSFSPKGFGSEPTISEPSNDDWMPVKDSAKVKLKSIFKEEGQKYVYIYDFGDNWEHTITLEAIIPGNAIKATCLAGKGACPPEDVGGVFMYEEMKFNLKEDPSGEEAKSFRDWLGLADGEAWEDVNSFDKNDVNEELLLL